MTARVPTTRQQNSRVPEPAAASADVCDTCFDNSPLGIATYIGGPSFGSALDIATYAVGRSFDSSAHRRTRTRRCSLGDGPDDDDLDIDDNETTGPRA